MTNLLEVNDLVVKFASRRGHIRAVDGVSLTVAAGAVLGLVGESGSGKSTTARAIMRLIPASSGSVRLAGIDVLRARRSDMRKVRRKMQMVFQDPYSSLDPRLTAEDAIGEGIDVNRLSPSRRERRDSIVELMELVGLTSEQLAAKPDAFSGGQRQRIAIARALAVRPELLICDEPVTALDASVRAQVLNLFSDLRERLGLAFVFISHDLAIVRHFAQTVAVMQDGRIVEKGVPLEMFEAPQHPYTRALLLASPVPDPAFERDRRQRRTAAIQLGETYGPPPA